MNSPRIDQFSERKLDPELADALIDGASTLACRAVDVAACHPPRLGWMDLSVRRMGAVALWAELLGVDWIDDTDLPGSLSVEWNRGYREERVRVGAVLNGAEAVA